jgi:hypothetical protein
VKPAPAFDCADCGRRIGKQAVHAVVEGEHPPDPRVICSRCYLAGYTWRVIHGTRAGVAAYLGMWP